MFRLLLWMKNHYSGIMLSHGQSTTACLHTWPKQWYQAIKSALGAFLRLILLTCREMKMISHSWPHVWLTDITPTIVVSRAAVTPICVDRKGRTLNKTHSLWTYTWAHTYTQTQLNSIVCLLAFSHPNWCLVFGSTITAFTTLLGAKENDSFIIYAAYPV